MKKVIRPFEREESIYYSDFSGKLIGEMYPTVKMNFEFNYGSKFDGLDFELDLNDEDAIIILDFLKKHLLDESKKILPNYEIN